MMSMRAHPAALLALLICGGPAWASNISFVTSFKNIAYNQTGDGATLSLGGTFFSADLDAKVANAYSTVAMTYPGPGSPQNLPQTSPTVYHFQTGLLPNQAAMDAAYPFGTYTFTGDGTDTTNYSYTADDYSQSLPYLTGTDFTQLQGMDPSQPFQLHFNPFVTGGNASASFIFFTIFDHTTNAFVFDAGFQPATTTSLTLPGHTLTSGDSYTYELDYSNRDLLASPGAEFNAQLGFDVRTDGDFRAGAVAPEPGTIGLSGLALLAAFTWRSKRNVAAK